MKAEHHRRRQAAAQREMEAERHEIEAEREAEREVKREARRQARIGWLKNLEVQCRELFGDDAPLPADIELADWLSPTRLYRAGMVVQLATVDTPRLALGALRTLCGVINGALLSLSSSGDDEGGDNGPGSQLPPAS